MVMGGSELQIICCTTRRSCT